MSDDYRLPPNDIESEEAVIAAALVQYKLVPSLSSIVQPSDFFREKNAWIWEAICYLSSKDSIANQITVASELARRNQLEDVGGQAYLSDLIRRLPTYEGSEFYAESVKRASTYRKILGVGSYTTQAAFAASAPPESVLEQVYRMLAEVEGHADSGQDWHTTESLLDGGYEDALRERIEEPGKISGLATGLEEFDRKLGGFKPKKVYVIGAKTSVGKSIIVADFIRKMENVRHAVYTTEMGGEEFIDRMVYQQAGIDKEMAAREGAYTEREVERLNAALDKLRRHVIYFNDRSELTIHYIRNSMKKLMLKQNVGIVWIDHIDTMVGEANNFNRVAVLADITRGLKNFANAANIPVVYTSQRNRSEVGGDLNKSLRDGGSKEEYADATIFPIPVDPATNEELEPDVARARALEPGWTKFKVVIAKNRGGTTGAVELFCDYRHGGRWGSWKNRPRQWDASFTS